MSGRCTTQKRGENQMGSIHSKQKK